MKHLQGQTKTGGTRGGKICRLKQIRGARYNICRGIERIYRFQGKCSLPLHCFGYKRMERNYFHEIKNKKLSAISQKAVQGMINGYATNLSPKTIQNIHGLFSAVMRMYAPDRSFYTKLPQKKKTEIHIPSEKDIKIIREFIKGSPLEIPFYWLLN